MLTHPLLLRSLARADGEAEQILSEVADLLGRHSGDGVAPAVSCALSSLLFSEHNSGGPGLSATAPSASGHSFGSGRPSSRRWSLSSAPGGARNTMSNIEDYACGTVLVCCRAWTVVACSWGLGFPQARMVIFA